jgi:hypothetical protein
MPEEWHYIKDGQSHGPISLQELKDIAASGELQPADLVWTEGQNEWKPAQSIEGLVSGNQTNEQVPPPITGYTPGTPSAVAQQSVEMARRVLSRTPSDSTKRTIQQVAWILCGIVIVLGSCLFVLMEGSAESAIQQGAIGALFSTVFIAAYVLARAIEKFTNL